MDNVDFALFEAELREHYDALQEVYDKIYQRQATFKDSIEGIESIAYQLHNLYGGYEKLFETVALFFENQIEGARYHADLLLRMKIEIKGIRPALLSKSSHGMLDELRRFRHFFRHAYRAELDVDRVDRLLQTALQLEKPFREDMEHFLAQLKPNSDDYE